jgi:hypothetical protein
LSAETYNTLQEAITAHVADELQTDVVLVKDWVLVASTSDLDSIDGYEEIVVHRSPNTPLYSVTGLLHWGATTMAPTDYLED